MALVEVIIGSKTDESYIEGTLAILEEMGISHNFNVISAHRAPDKLHKYVNQAVENGVEVFITAAGGAAALPGVVASLTVCPVIGIPLPTSDIKGVDALYSIVQMPPGIPVACVSVGAWGCRNAAYMAAAILGIKYPEIQEQLKAYRKKISQ
tara:strand:- start:2396 stop:2851 length:456 start_codon:yes stop_codon:yes gene_type:complete